jgi:type I restriction enzyme S subunit
MSWTTVPLRDVVRDVRSGFASGKDIPDGVLQFRMNNITAKGAIDLTKKRRVPSPKRGVEEFLLQPGDVLFNATNSPELVGKSAYFPGLDEPVTFSNHFLRLRPSGVEGRYLARWLMYEFSRGAFQPITRRWVNQAAIDKDALLDREIPLPTLKEQRRIADILDRFDTIRTKRRASIVQLDILTRSIFLEMFAGYLAISSDVTLNGIAEPVRGSFVNGPFGSNLLTSELLPEGVPVIYIRDIRQGEYVRVSSVCVTTKKAQQREGKLAHALGTETRLRLPRVTSSRP